MVRLTFTLDEETVAQLRRTAARLSRPLSQVVREAIREYSTRSDKLGDEERNRLLDIFDRMVPAIRPRPLSEVEAEMRAVRAARRRGGRRHPAR